MTANSNSNKIRKYIFVTGGVVSGLGKGITAASLGMMLKAKGLNVTAQKLDPYINMAPSNMSPLQHGEVYVTEDGAEGDLDLGHYERFIDVNLNKFSNITTGKIYNNIFENERKGLYGGDTIQVIPHITNEIKRFIYSVGKKNDADIVISEIGGTTGDIESLPYIEAIRQVANEVGRENCLFIHVTLAVVIKSSGEMKSKPTQHSVKELRSLGISPNIIVLRCDREIDDDTRAKISMFCNVEPDCVIENSDVKLLYEVPQMLEKSNFTSIVSRELGLDNNKPDTKVWEKMLTKARARKQDVKIALVGNYVKMYDAYISLSEALTHAGIENGVNINLEWVGADKLTDSDVDSKLQDCQGIVVSGGFGENSINGMVSAIKYARVNDIPFLGISLGFQAAAIEFARNVLNLEDADSKEYDPNALNKIIDFAHENSSTGLHNDNLRLGSYEMSIKDNTLAKKIYKSSTVSERHRNKYEFNTKYQQIFEDAGFIASIEDEDGDLVEAMELTGKKFFMGVQFFPEFKSRPHVPHPLFIEFVKSVKGI